MAKYAKKQAKQARIAFEKWRENFKDNINCYHEFYEFVMGKQWEDDEEKEMIKTFRKVPLTANKLGSMANSLLGEQQQNTPQLEVIPLTDCDEKTAELRQAIVKDISLSQDAKTVYQVAASQAIIGGFSAFMWYAEEPHNESFDQEIKPAYFKDPTLCYWDSGAETIGKTDGMFCGYITPMTRKKFVETYGKNVADKIGVKSENGGEIAASEEEVALATSISSDLGNFQWFDEDMIMVQDHFVRKIKKRMIYKLSNAKTVTQDELDEIIEKSRLIALEQQEFALIEGEQTLDALTPDQLTLYDDGMPVRIEREKEVQYSEITHQKIAGDYILEEALFPTSENLPVVFVDQNSYYDKKGKQVTRPFFKDSKDTQRYINYLRTQSAYILKISRYDQFIASKKNVASSDTQANWRNPLNIQGAITYDESPNGNKPEQLRPPELSASLHTQYQIAGEDLYTTTGLYPTRLGQQGNEISGSAIDARTRQGSYQTYVVFTSINRAIATGGAIVNEMIPHIYDAERLISVRLPDRGLQNIVINKQIDAYGEQFENDIRKGTFKVVLRPGPSYEGQKQVGLQSLQQVLQANPQTFNMIADLYAENLPLANTIELKNRLRTLVPKQILEAGKTGQPLPPEPRQPDLQTLQAMAKMKELELKEQELKLKAQDQQSENAREIQRLEQERLQIAAELEGKNLDFMAETHRTNTDAEMARADNLVKLLTDYAKTTGGSYEQ